MAGDKSTVLNNSFGSKYVFANPQLSKAEEDLALASIFEQLMIFDRVTLTTSRLNFALAFMIKKIGINNVERLLEAGYLNFILWSPIIITSIGQERADKTMDESVIYGQAPIVGGVLGAEDLDPEKNINTALALFDIHKDRKRIFTRKAVKNYTVPDGMLLATDSAKLVIDAYENNNLEMLGLPYEKAPDQLNVEERGILLDLGHTVIETAVLSQYGLKSFENYKPYEIYKKNLDNIGSAYNISENASEIFKIENVPDLKELFLKERLDFDSVFKLRHKANAKYFRKWINNVGENSNSQEVTKEYLNEVKGNTKYFETAGGKLVKHLTMLGANAGLGALIAGPLGGAAGIALGLMETFCLDSILVGKNPSMFIKDIENEIAPEQKLSD